MIFLLFSLWKFSSLEFEAGAHTLIDAIGCCSLCLSWKERLPKARLLAFALSREREREKEELLDIPEQDLLAIDAKFADAF